MLRITLFTLLFTLFTTVFLVGQEAREGSYELHKKVAKQANGVYLRINAPDDEIEETMQAAFKESANVKASKVARDVYAFEGATFPSISELKLNYFYRLESVKKQEDLTDVYFFLSLGNDNFMTSDRYPRELEAAKSFVRDLEIKTRRRLIQANLAQRREVLANASDELEDVTKSLEKATEEENDLREEMAELQEKLAELEASINELRSQQQRLQTSVTEEEGKIRVMESDLSNLR
jgi:DNA repair exonuclease SbcCD ATPase subunit